MGQFLDKPNTEKESHSGSFEDGACTYGLSSMQGWRVHMEDAHVHEAHIPSLPNSAFFAVLDGHGGATVSTKSAPMMLPTVLNSKPIKSALKSGNVTAEILREGYREGILALDLNVKESNPDLKAGHDRSGSTVISCFVTETHYVVGNTGDSRLVVGNGTAVKFATEDHKPMDEGERKRITDAGGFVEMGRVCGNLAVSRALGDYEYKDRPDLTAEEQKITVNPDMTVLDREGSDSYLVIACDGIWDVMNNEQAIAFVDYYHKRARTSVEIAELLLDHCLEAGSKDNMSVIVIVLPGAPDARSPPASESEAERDVRINAEIAEIQVLMAKLSNLNMEEAAETSTK